MSRPRVYRYKPDFTFEAVRWTGVLDDLWPEWRELDLIFQEPGDNRAIVRTRQGLANAEIGDYIKRGVDDERYPVRRIVAQASWEPVGDTE